MNRLHDTLTLPGVLGAWLSPDLCVSEEGEVDW